MVSAEAAALPITTLARIRPRPRATASMTSGIPWPLASGASQRVSAHAPTSSVGGFGEVVVAVAGLAQGSDDDGPHDFAVVDDENVHGVVFPFGRVRAIVVLDGPVIGRRFRPWA